MSIIARESAATAPAIHGITGLAAIVLMLFHAIWATVVYVQGRGHNASALKREQTFHRLSAAVWMPGSSPTSSACLWASLLSSLAQRPRSS